MSNINYASKKKIDIFKFQNKKNEVQYRQNSTKKLKDLLSYSKHNKIISLKYKKIEVKPICLAA